MMCCSTSCEKTFVTFKSELCDMLLVKTSKLSSSHITIALSYIMRVCLLLLMFLTSYGNLICSPSSKHINCCTWDMDSFQFCSCCIYVRPVWHSSRFENSLIRSWSHVQFEHLWFSDLVHIVECKLLNFILQTQIPALV
jgi:hypothetical protein